MSSLAQVIRRTVQVCGSKTATRFNGRVRTWAEYQERISRLDEDGVLFIVDRVKDMIVSGGENVYSAETEQAIYTHPAITECAVIGIPHDSWGEKVHAIVCLKEGESVTEPELIEHCKTLIAAFKCPKSIEFREDPLPLSGAGKILKKDLRAVYWENQDRNVG